MNWEIFVKIAKFIIKKLVDEPLDDLVLENVMKKKTLEKKIKELRELKKEAQNSVEKLSKKEINILNEKIEKLTRSLNGTKHTHIRNIQAQAKHDVDVKNKRVLS